MSVEIHVTKIEANRGRLGVVSVVIESENLDKSNRRSTATLRQTQTPRNPLIHTLGEVRDERLACAGGLQAALQSPGVATHMAHLSVSNEATE